MECFVCASSDPPLFRVCSCATLVHRACFERLVSVPAHATRCAVCTDEYQMDVQHGWRVGVHPVCSKALVAVCLLGGGSLACLFALLSQSQSALDQTVFYTTLGAVASAVAFVSTVIARLSYRQTGHVCCLWMQKVPLKRILRLPEPVQPDARTHSPPATSLRGEGGGADDALDC